MDEDFTEEPGPESQPLRRDWRMSLLLSLIVVVVGVFGAVTTIATGRGDSAVLFVFAPTLLALAIVLSAPARSPHGMIFKGLTLGMLLVAIVLHEGAICVVFAAPIVYLVGHGVTAALMYSRDRWGAIALIPLALLAGTEGVQPDWRITPTQTVSVTRVVALSPVDVEARIAAGPRLAETPKPWLLALMPMPAHMIGTGVAPGDRWTFHFDGDRHGPGGELVMAVTEHDDDLFELSRVRDSSIVDRWIDWGGARITWHAVAAGTEVTMELTFTRGLDPSWYFGPVDQGLIYVTAGYLLNSLNLR